MLKPIFTVLVTATWRRHSDMLRKPLALGLVMASLCVSTTVVAAPDRPAIEPLAPAANDTATAALREQQRAWFEQAEYAAARGRLDEYQLLLQKLGDYPLLPYLELERLQRVGYLANEPRVMAFLERHQGSPLDWQLRQRWLTYLARAGEKERFIRDFRAPGTTEHRCLNLDYSHELEVIPDQAFYAAVAELWLTGDSLPDECDGVLQRWRAAGQLTPELVWQRIALAAEDGRHTLIPYLTGLLPESQRYLAELYHEVRRNPANITRLGSFKADQYQAQQAQIAAYAYQRLIWRDEDSALANWPKAAEFFAFNDAQLKQITQTFALALSNKNHPQARIWQAKVPLTEASEAVLQWRLVNLLRAGEFANLARMIEQLPASISQGNQWRYWLARSYQQLGNELAAQQLLQVLATERHYYGFMAASWLQQQPQLERQQTTASPMQLEVIRTHPSAQRAYEFRAMGRMLDARREWNFMLSQLSAEEQVHAAVLANEWGWHDQAIFGLAAIGHFDAVQIRFPLAYHDVLKSFASIAGIDETWALAITRRESAFRNDAYSSAGARGLMQILPSTARYLGERDVSRNELHMPRLNIQLGTKYLGQLQQRMQNNWVLATASYNAGIYRVQEWLPQQAVPVDIWIETIPYYETRDYVKNVLAYQQIYTMLLGRETNLFNELIDMKIQK